VHERADAAALQVFDMSEKVVKIQPAVDWSLVGTSAVGSILEKKTDMNGGIFSPHPIPNPDIDQLIASSESASTHL